MVNNKKTVVVTKLGGVLYMPEAGHRASSVGEQGETLSVLRRLVELNLHVVYYGPVRGELPVGVHHVDTILDGINENCSTHHHDLCFMLGEELLARHDPDLFVHVLGYSVPACYIGNSWGARIQSAGARYVAPALHAVHTFQKPRVCINNDPRSYPKEQEQTRMWDGTLPWALLSQRTGTVPRTIGGKKLEQREVYAGAELWWTHGLARPVQRTVKTSSCTIVSHAHIADGCKKQGRDNVWQVIFSDKDENLFTVEDYERLGIRVHGAGWEHFTGYSPDIFPGKVRPSEVSELLANTWCGPIVAPENGFYTGKASVYVFNHVLPFPWGMGLQDFTYDLHGRTWEMDHFLRITGSGDLEKRIDAWGGPSVMRDELVEEAWSKLRPDWRLFDDCINDALLVRPNWERYGGLRIL